MNTHVAAGSSSGAGDVTGPPFALEPLPGPPDTLVVHGVEYSIIRALGVGSYAQVVEVCGPGGQRFAAKCIDQAPLSAWARSQLAAEVEIQQSLLHPHILRMHAAGEDKVSGRFVCILDVAHGGELFERIMEEQSFVEDDARRVLKQLLAAVSHMHTHGILHRDLKPENILLETSAADSPIKVADFGSAKRLAPSGPLAHASTPCGSMGYAAPEQIALHRYEREVDMWAVGVIAYVLLSGSMPFDPAHYADALVSDSFEVVLLPEQWADISAPAKDFVLSLLQLQPERRPKVEQALRHPWLQSLHCRAASPLPQPQLCTPRQLKRLRDAGMLHHHWAHANEIWHYACSTPRLGGGMLPELPMPSPLLLPTAVEVPMAREGEVPLLCPPQQVRERAEAQRNKRRKLHSPPAVQPAGGTAAEGSMPPPLARDASFNAFELNGGSPPAGSRGAAGAPHTALEAGTVVGSSELSQKEATLSNEL